MTPYLTESIECYLITNPLCKFYHLFIDAKTNFRMVRLALISRFTDLDRRLLAQLIFKISRWLKADDRLSAEKVERKILNDPWQGRLVSSWSTIF